MARRINIIIAETSTIIRCGIISLIQYNSSLNFDIVEISDVSTITSGSFKQSPDILIINPLLMANLSLTQLKNSLDNGFIRVIALQTSLIDQALMSGYDDLISLYDSSETIREKIEAVVDKKNNENIQRDLSAREKEIIVCVVKGMTNKQIADTLFISSHTVIAHRRNIASKLQIHSPAGLTIYAIVNKLVDLSDVKKAISK